MLAPGAVYTVMGGRTITPQPYKVTVVWVENDCVHYRLNNDKTVLNTSLTRFMEIVQHVGR